MAKKCTYLVLKYLPEAHVCSEELGISCIAQLKSNLITA